MQAFTKALYCLLSNPEYIEPLRHDVETAVAEEGWTKAGMDKMHKIDSFLRESQRVDDIGPLDSPSRTSVTDALPPLYSDGDPSRITPIYIFQWSHCSCGHANLPPVCRCPYGWRDLSKPRAI